MTIATKTGPAAGRRSRWKPRSKGRERNSNRIARESHPGLSSSACWRHTRMSPPSCRGGPNWWSTYRCSLWPSTWFSDLCRPFEASSSKLHRKCLILSWPTWRSAQKTISTTTAGDRVASRLWRLYARTGNGVWIVIQQRLAAPKSPLIQWLLSSTVSLTPLAGRRLWVSLRAQFWIFTDFYTSCSSSQPYLLSPFLATGHSAHWDNVFSNRTTRNTHHHPNPCTHSCSITPPSDTTGSKTPGKPKELLTTRNTISPWCSKTHGRWTLSPSALVSVSSTSGHRAQLSAGLPKPLFSFLGLGLGRRTCFTADGFVA